MTDHRPPTALPSASPHTRKRFALTGHSTAVDPRVEAARGDLADVRLADRIFAPHYAAPVGRTAIAQTPLLAAHGGEPVSELLKGERFDVLELSHGYAWGVGAADGAVGFVAMDALGPPEDVTHIVCGASSSFPIGTQLTAIEAEQTEAATIRPLEAPAKDYVAIAESLVGVPVLGGGRSGQGVDAAGLVVLSLSIAGLKAPRFVDLQAATLGHEISSGAPILRGDLLFSEESVAIAADEASAIYADDTAVVHAPIAAFGPITIRRRLP